MITQNAMRQELLNMSTALANLRQDRKEVRDAIGRYD